MAEVLSVLGGLLLGGGGVLGWFKLRSENRHNDAQAWHLLITDLRQQVKDLKEHVDDVEKRLQACEQRWREREAND